MAKSKKSFVAYLAVTYGKSGLPSGYKLSPAKKEAEVWAKAPPDTLKKPDASSDEKPEIPDKNNDHSSFLKLMIRSYETMISHYSLISTSISLGKFSTATYLAFDVIKPISDNSEIVSSGDDWKLYGLKA